MPHSPAARWALKMTISRPCRPCAVAPTPRIDRAWPHCSGNVAVPWHDSSSSSENGVLNTLPRHQILRNRGCAAGVNNSFTHGGEMEPWRYTNAPALCCCGLRRAWRHSAARRCARLLTGSPSCEGYVLTGSCIVRMCSACAAKVDSIHNLLAAGRAAVLQPPG